MLKFILLGAIQGLTEFLPLSSSGHLVIAGRLLGLAQNALALSVILHLGTACALLVFFFRDLLELLGNLKLLLFLLVVTAITAVIGLLGKSFFESLFSSTTAVAVALVVTGVTLIFTKGFMQGKRDSLNIKDAFILGLTQAAAIIPGISRSGITISTLLFRGIERQESMRISFLAAIPVIFGAALLESRKIDFALKTQWQGMFLGFLFSFVFGILALKILKLILQKMRLYYFGYYCIFIAVITLIFIR